MSKDIEKTKNFSATRRSDFEHKCKAIPADMLHLPGPDCG